MDARRIVRWMWLPAGAVAIYTAIVMGVRWQENQALEENARQRRAEVNREIVERYGDGELKVLTFYANPARVSAGGKSLLCYGVANAKSVRIDPPVEGVSPSLSRCVEVRPAKDTTYTLAAMGRSGEQASATLKLQVR